MIGTEDHARTALECYRDGDDSFVLSYNGSTRIVFLIDGVVYKVDTSRGFTARSFSDNLMEYENITRFDGELPDGIHFPEVSLYQFGNDYVIAMEYIEGQAMSECYCIDGEEHDASCMPDDIYMSLQGILDDTGGENIILTDNGDIYIIDFA